MAYYIVVPARYDSVRLPGKALVDIHGKSMIEHVYQRAEQAGADGVIVATDDQRIVDVIKGLGGNACLTKASHRSGTERIAEVIDKIGMKDDDLIVNLQGDEPLVPVANISQLHKNLAQQTDCHMVTLCDPIEHIDDLFDPNIVKVVRDAKGFALTFSRAPIPWYRDGFAGESKQMPPNFQYYRHIGLYGYRAAFVKQYVEWAHSPLERVESLEQLRVLWYGEKIHVDVALEAPGPGIDTYDDLELARQMMK